MSVVQFISITEEKKIWKQNEERGTHCFDAALVVSSLFTPAVEDPELPPGGLPTFGKAPIAGTEDDISVVSFGEIPILCR